MASMPNHNPIVTLTLNPCWSTSIVNFRIWSPTKIYIYICVLTYFQINISNPLLHVNLVKVRKHETSVIYETSEIVLTFICLNIKHLVYCSVISNLSQVHFVPALFFPLVMHHLSVSLADRK